MQHQYPRVAGAAAPAPAPAEGCDSTAVHCVPVRASGSRRRPLTTRCQKSEVDRERACEGGEERGVVAVRFHKRVYTP